MPHQVPISVVAPLTATGVESVRAELGTIAGRAAEPPPLPFPEFPGLHFARLFVLAGIQGLDGAVLPPRLVYLANVDAPEDAHLLELVSADAMAFDRIFGHCEGFPEPERRTVASRLTFLRDHAAPSQVFYANRNGRSVAQIAGEERLRRALDAFLDSQDFSAQTPDSVRARIIEHVRTTPDLAWALRPPQPPASGWRWRERLHALLAIALMIVLTPLLLVLLPVFLLLLYRQERRDEPDRSAAPDAHIRALRDDEDLGGQNQIIAAGIFKPGWFRRTTTRGVLFLADFATRHIYNRGKLAGLNTIHFARWVSIDDGRGLFFSSNYDGSLESYMNDFIDKAAWGLNAIFSNGDGFPRTSFLFCGGIMDEQAYKRFLPTRQVASQVFYSAYPQLSTKNIANNAEIRLGLGRDLNPEQTRAWLRRFGVGNELPPSGVVERLLDRIPWHTLCRYQPR